MKPTVEIRTAYIPMEGRYVWEHWSSSQCARTSSVLYPTSGTARTAGEYAAIDQMEREKVKKR